MNKRIVVGIFIVVVMAAVVVLREYHTVFFDIFVVALMMMGGIEMAKALEQKMPAPLISVIIMFPVLSYAAFVLGLNTNIDGMSLVFLMVAIVFLAMMVVTLFNKNIDTKNVLSTLFVMIYPQCLFSILFAVNNNPINEKFALIPLALIFIISSFTDTMAYFIGIALKGPKLAPAISPKKTISGSIGGLLGGLIGSMLVFLLCYFKVYTFNLLNVSLGINILHFLIIGIFGSVFTQIGDLVASIVKRQLEIKDYGKILPGHGGIMDRFDGLLLNAVFVYTYFLIMYLFGVIKVAV